MEVLQRQLTDGERLLLTSLVADSRPHLGSAVARLGEEQLSCEDREHLWDLLSDELMESGLQADGEPNERGRAVDSIIGKLLFY